MRTKRKSLNTGSYSRLSIRSVSRWCLVLTAVLMISCVRYISRTYVFEQSTYRPGLRELKELASGFATPRYTLLVLFDLQIARCALGMEMDYWPIWKEHMEEQGFGFAFITSRADSMDVAVAMKMEGNSAPVYVLPGCEENLSDLWTPGSEQALKLLIDSTGTTHFLWFVVRNSVENEQFLARIDSVIALDTL